MELVTIAIASYNNAPYIERCIDSVIEQTYTQLDILIVDDGSKDDTINRLEAYKTDKRVRVISKENDGLSSARQMALREAKGEYICFIDADDYLVNNYVERMISKLLEDGSNICVCSTKFEDEAGVFLPKESKILSCKESENPIHVRINDFMSPNEHFSDQFFLSDSWNKMYETAFIRKTGVGFNMPKGLNGTDSVFNRRLFLHLPCYSFVEDSLYVHVVYKSSAVHRKHKDLMSTTTIIVEQLWNESKIIGKESELQRRLSLLYYRGSLTAFRDVYLESNACNKEFWELVSRHKGYIKEHTNIKLSLFEIKSYELKSFVLVLKYASFLLPLYFKAHSRIVR